jgi:carbon-monoxide dehydrogenase medium subunit
MGLSEITLHRPRHLDEAIKLLGELKGSRILAGGTDLLVDLKQNTVRAKNLISLQDIYELKGIEEKKGRIRIGAMVTSKEIHSHGLIGRYFPVLAEAARLMASPQIRSVATIGGNIASAVPSADLPPSLIAADATIFLTCGTEREISLVEFFTGPRETVCGPGEILVSVMIPIPPPCTGISYKKMTLREANALAVAGVASRLTLENGKIEKAAVVLGAVAPTPFLAARASKLLCGETPTDCLFEEVSSVAQEEARPISDIRGSSWYRRELIQVLTRRTLEQALERSRKYPEEEGA